MKKPDTKTQEPLAQAWALLDEKSYPEAAQASFWQRFEAELGEEEQHRQSEAAMAQLNALSTEIPAYTKEAKGRFWQRFEAELSTEERRRQTRHSWHQLWLTPLTDLLQSQARWPALGAAVCLAAVTTWGIIATPTQTTQPAATHAQQTAPPRQVTAPKAPSPKLTPHAPALYKDMPMLQNLAMFENMEMLQQSDALKRAATPQGKGS